MRAPKVRVPVHWHWDGNARSATIVRILSPMGLHESALTRVLSEVGWTRSATPSVARIDKLPAQTQNEIAYVYYSLGGRDPLPVKTGPWDMAFGDLVIEFDEEQHFNRYRRATLEIPLAARLPWRSSYSSQCETYETACSRKASNGGYWTNASAERMFGPPGSKDDLNGSGSPRWKQRAVYDLIRDATAISGGVRLARLSRWDEIGDAPLWRALSESAPVDKGRIAGTNQRPDGWLRTGARPSVPSVPPATARVDPREEILRSSPASAT
ncbi:DUF7255 family protein [Mycolicibacterium neoaurum]|uniref:DUF7255 family protein n=2 Tax=Mycolicibacterium neoaurum TaxID=1795 RepID=UPI003D6D775B